MQRKDSHDVEGAYLGLAKFLHRKFPIAQRWDSLRYNLACSPLEEQLLLQRVQAPYSIPGR